MLDSESGATQKLLRFFHGKRLSLEAKYDKHIPKSDSSVVG